MCTLIPGFTYHLLNLRHLRTFKTDQGKNISQITVMATSSGLGLLGSSPYVVTASHQQNQYLSHSWFSAIFYRISLIIFPWHVVWPMSCHQPCTPNDTYSFTSISMTLLIGRSAWNPLFPFWINSTQVRICEGMFISSTIVWTT